MMTPGAGTKVLQMSPEELAWETDPVPAGALKVARGSRSQSEIACPWQKSPN
jgi:hypothetical protein